MLVIHLIYWTHWILDIAFLVACLSVIFKPHIFSRLYITVFLAQQLILNGCIMSLLENKAMTANGYQTLPNRFIMDELFTGHIISIYKVLFIVIILIESYYIVKETREWANKKRQVV